MGIPLRTIEEPKHFRDSAVGDMWRTPEHDLGGREAWAIHLPDNPSGGSDEWPNVFVTTLGYPDKMWDVSGQAPNITISPSIFCDAPTGWHGFVRNGEIVDA